MGAGGGRGPQDRHGELCREDEDCAAQGRFSRNERVARQMPRQLCTDRNIAEAMEDALHKDHQIQDEEARTLQQGVDGVERQGIIRGLRGGIHAGENSMGREGVDKPG